MLRNRASPPPDLRAPSKCKLWGPSFCLTAPVSPSFSCRTLSGSQASTAIFLPHLCPQTTHFPVLKGETSSPKCPSAGGGGTAANHGGVLCSSSSPFPHPPLLLGEIGAHQPPLETPPLLWFPRPSPNSRGSQEPQPTAGARGGRAPPLQVGRRDEVQTLSGGGLRRPFPRAALPGACLPHGAGRGSARRRRRCRGRRTRLGWATGAYLGARAAGAWGSGSSSREAVACARAAAAVPPGLRWGFAQTLSRGLLQPGRWRRGGGGGNSSALRGPRTVRLRLAWG